MANAQITVNVNYDRLVESVLAKLSAEQHENFVLQEQVRTLLEDKQALEERAAALESALNQSYAPSEGAKAPEIVENVEVIDALQTPEI